MKILSMAVKGSIVYDLWITRRGDTAYPGVEIFPDGTVVTTTYGHWTKDESPYIMSVRFTFEELDNKVAEN